jgi:hypothetical protein
MTTERITLAEFINKHGVRMTCEPTDRNPLMDPDGSRMDHWHCVLRCGGRQMTLTFSMGVAHAGREPKADEVLNCIASDSASIENARSFEDWAGELGYDEDSRKAEKVYKACQAQAEKAKALLGEVAYGELLWNTEQD